MTSIDTTHDDALREVPFAKEDIYNGRILHVEKWKVTCPNGREAAREIVVHKGAAAVVPVFENGDTLLVRQHRVAAERMTHLTTILTTPGFCTEKIAIYLAQGLSQGETHPDEDEFLGLIRMPLEEAFERVMRGEIHDSKTICGLMMAREAVARRKL